MPLTVRPSFGYGFLAVTAEPILWRVTTHTFTREEGVVRTGFHKALIFSVYSDIFSSYGKSLMMLPLSL